jgi:23S rRNA pseudouridine955/2504/2580 synthase
MSNQENILYVPAGANGLRLDKWLLTQFPTVPYTAWARFCRKGNVRLQGKRVTGAERLVEGQAVRIPPLDVLKQSMITVESLKVKPLSEAAKDQVESWIIYEDEDLLCLNKPAGLAVQGGTKTITHVDGLLSRWALQKKFTPKLVHRIDRDTSGVLLIAKTDHVARELGKSFKNHQIQKYYVAVTVGVPTPLVGTINASLAKGIQNNKERMMVSEGGLRAVTNYQVLDKIGKKMAVVGLSPVSGRTHQLRVHLGHINTPILGDPKYGGDQSEFATRNNILHLHSCITIVSRVGKKPYIFQADFPSHFQTTFKNFGFSPASVMHELKQFMGTKNSN